MRIAKLILLGPLLILGACAASIHTDVVSFHKLDKPEGETYNIIPKDEGVEAGLEFNTYAKFVETELNTLGYRPSFIPYEADLIVKISYRVGDGKEKIKSLPRMGGFRGNWGFGIGLGNNFFWPGFHFSQSELYSYTQYTRQFEMDIINVDTKEILFEGRVISRGKDKRLPEGVPFLVKALFKNFPGESGKTRKVVISPKTP